MSAAGARQYAARAERREGMAALCGECGYDGSRLLHQSTLLAAMIVDVMRRIWGVTCFTSDLLRPQKT